MRSPTLKIEGWGTRDGDGDGNGNGNGNGKDDYKDKDNHDGNSKDKEGSFAALRMTTKCKRQRTNHFAAHRL
jgi:hypothetical protein